MLYYPNIPVTNLFTWLTWQLMELLQLHDGEGEELGAIGDRCGYRVAHPEGFAGTYDFLAGTDCHLNLHSIKTRGIQSKIFEA